MIRKILFVLVGVLTAFALAQGPVVYPTTGDGPDAYAKGSGQENNSASVTQEVQLILPYATALHLDVTSIGFDLTSLDGEGWPHLAVADFAHPEAAVVNGGNMVCVYGSTPQDQQSQLGPDFYNQVQYLPLGTSYQPAPSGWPNVQIVTTGGVVTAYPPMQIDANGELIVGSKGHFVCYRSFLLQKFSNGTQWDLTVERTDEGTAAIENLYIQDNPCDTFGQATGFYRLDQGDSLHLVPESLGQGPTGAQAASNPALCGYKSWLDDLVIIAVKIDGETAGTTTATLDYTMTTTAWTVAD